MSNDNNSVSSGGPGGGLNLNLPMNYNVTSSPSPLTGAPIGNIGGNVSGAPVGSRLPLSSTSSGDLSSGGLPNLLGGGQQQQQQQQLQGAPIAGLTNMNINLAPLSSGGMGSAVIGGGVAIGNNGPNINMNPGGGGGMMSSNQQQQQQQQYYWYRSTRTSHSGRRCLQDHASVLQYPDERVQVLHARFDRDRCGYQSGEGYAGGVDRGHGGRDSTREHQEDLR
mmetsp:Transcript_17291/g.37570  ORF Transcript_17291/g.37570 Transcript_17291/m.37570 type:complete len:223 (-) Transcript_17291:2626-3294(-)